MLLRGRPAYDCGLGAHYRVFRRGTSRAKSVRRFVRTRNSTSGFTLVEMMIVVGIVAILTGVAVFNVTQSRRRVTVERALADLRGRIARAQSLAAVAGSRLGNVVGTPRFVYGAGCTAAPERQLWVRFNGGTVEIPSQLRYDDLTDELTVQCDTFDIAAETRGIGTLLAPPAGTVLGFSPNGRSLTIAGPAAPLYVQADTLGDTRKYGFRVLSSGVLCSAMEPAVPAAAFAAPAGPLCSEDL